MNPMIYEELRPGHRRFRSHLLRLTVHAWIPIVTAVVLAVSVPPPRPVHYAVTGLGLAGLLILAALRRMETERNPGPLARSLNRNRDAWFPAIMVLGQNYFVSLTIALLWTTMVGLGFSAGPLQHALLAAVLVVSPFRRLLFGTYPPHPGPLREISVEFVRYTFVCLLTLFIASLGARMALPPDARLTQTLPAPFIILWIAASLVCITCAVLFIDHLLRKMPSPTAGQPKDVLE